MEERQLKKERRQKHHNPKKNRIISICVLVTGIICLAVGVTFLIINFVRANQAADGDFLVSAGNWVLEDGDSVIWDFTEIGKGTLTTNAHINDYDFSWAIEDNRITIETDWLYSLKNEYTYELNQGSKTLTLTDDSGKNFVFKAE